MKMLNIGCGSAFHPDWVNADVEPSAPSIIRLDASRGLPFSDNTFDICYSSHVLEHLKQAEAAHFLSEIRRIMKPGGIVRLAVPDLEGIVRSYLQTFDQAMAGNKEAEMYYDWMVIELLDQMVRKKSGGKMGDYLKECPSAARSFVLSRMGSEAAPFFEASGKKEGLYSRLANKSPHWFLDQARYLLLTVIVTIFGGKRGIRSFKEGWFMTSGEAHQWMYDSFSLGRLLREAGFQEVAVCSPYMSRIPGFDSYGLDVNDGKVRKPDSLFMEGVCP